MSTAPRLGEFLEPITTGTGADNLGKFLDELNRGRPVALWCSGRWQLLLPERVGGYPPSRRVIDLPLVEAPLAGPDVSPAQALDLMSRRAVPYALAAQGHRVRGVVREKQLREYLEAQTRLQTEEALRENQARLRLVLEQLPAVLWTTDRNLIFTSVTGGQSLNLPPVPPEEILGVSLFDFFQTRDENYLPIAAARRAVAGESVTYEMDWGGLTFHAHVEPFLGPAGEILGSIGAALDITERKQAEERLRESEEMHRLLSELTSDYAFVCRVEPDGSVVTELVTEGFVRTTGYTLAEMEDGGGWERLFHPEDLKVARERMALMLQGRRTVNEVRIITKGGAVRWIRYITLPIRDPAQGRVVRLIGAVQDITERKRAEEQLREYAGQLQALSRRLLEAQENERRRIAQELHDEVGQMLTGLKLSLEMAARQPPGEVADSLGQARALANQLIAQVRNLSLDLRPGMLDDLGLLPALVWHFQHYTAQTQVQVVFAHEGLQGRFPPAVETAAFRIVQEALTNVARHAGVRQATVRIWRAGGMLGIQVEDQGAGFAAAAARGPRTSSGLAGMRERATLLGGQLTIESAPGRGTRVTAELPLPEHEERNRHDFEDFAGG